MSDEFILGAAEKMDEIQAKDVEYGIMNGWDWGPGTHFMPSMIEAEDEAWAHDLHSVVFHGLGAHPQASFAFFNGHPSRIGYWLTEHDHYAAGGDLSGISSAMAAASTDPGVKAAHPAEAATLAAQAIYRLPSRADENGLRGGTDAKVRGAEMAPHLERILETYLPAVASAYDKNHNKKGRPTDDADGDGIIDLRHTATMPSGEALPNSPWFETAYLDRALGLIGRDRQALIDLRQAVNKAEAEGVTPGMTKDQFASHATRWSAAEGGIANAVGTGAIKGAQAKDDYALAWIELGQSAASEAAGAAGAGKHPVTSVGSGMLIDELAERARNTWASDAKNETAKQEAMAEQALTDYSLRLQFAADEAGLNGYQDENSGLTLTDAMPGNARDGVVTDPDGSVRLLTKEEFDALPADERSVAAASLHDLTGNALTLGGTVSETLIESAFNERFKKRFP